MYKVKSLLQRYFIFFLKNSSSGFCAPSNLLGKYFLLTFPFWMLCGVGAAIDSTLIINNEGVGYIEHKGLWSLALILPILMVLTVNLVKLYFDMQENSRYFFHDNQIPVEMRVTFKRFNSLLFLKSLEAKAILGLCLIVGLAGVIINIKQTFSPLATYGNDVFDSLKYTFGFFSTKAYFLLAWGVICPIMAYISLIIVMSELKIMKFIEQHGECIDLFNSDNCGGTSIFGNINTTIMLQLSCVFFVLLMLSNTHKANYLTLEVPLVISSLFFLSFGYFTRRRISNFVSLQKDKLTNVINVKMKVLFGDESIKSSLVFMKLMREKESIYQIHNTPYAKYTLLITNSIKFIPASIAIAKYIQEIIS